MTAAGLTVTDLSAGYGAGRDAASAAVLTGIDFELPAGECLAVVGRSGCGKSTLLNVLAGVHAPATGRVSAGGKLVAGGEPVATGDRRKAGSSGSTAGHAAYLFQQDLLLPWKGALANAVFASRVAARGEMRRDRSDLEARAAALLREFGLGASLDALPGELSGGMRQRVALARTMLMDRGLILLDEPFGSLDAVTREEMRRWLLDVMTAHPATWVLVTHDVDEAVLLGDHVAVLQRPAGAAEGLGAGHAEPRPAPADRGAAPREGRPSLRQRRERIWRPSPRPPAPTGRVLERRAS